MYEAKLQYKFVAKYYLSAYKPKVEAWSMWNEILRICLDQIKSPRAKLIYTNDCLVRGRRHLSNDLKFNFSCRSFHPYTIAEK